MVASASTIATSRRRRFGGADVALAALVIGVVSLMVVPLPTWLLDFLIASNLAASVAILLITIYVKNALDIAAFPTVLLLTTLVRLSLNVSSTRLILLQADAGEVIRAFGLFVVRGNYVVGAVIFLILALIQFIVIAKGSERVAEVGARFTLDAMPGKQMAIDAELRSGAIDGNEARRRRSQLTRESQFYGAMDGTMKFVKGDVIAGFLITLVNVLGGVAIGVGQKDLELGGALKRYGLLAIGDGLVTQIPALVLATAAGILVTRVASEDPDTLLGDELAQQLLGAPRALAVASVFVLLLAAVPGLPALPFLVIGALLFVASRRAADSPPPRAHHGATPVQRRADGSDTRFVPVVVPWSIEVGSELAPLMADRFRGGDSERPGLLSAAAALRELVFQHLGVPLPPGRVAPLADLGPREVVVSLHEVPALALEVPRDVPDAGVADHLVGAVLPLLERRAADYLGIAETQTLLDALEESAPAVVRQVVPKPVPLLLLSEVLRRLVEERVSIRDLRAILEALAQVAAADKDPLNLTEFVRAQLRRALTYELTQGERELGVVLLDGPIEETLRGSISRTAAGSFLTLSPAAGRDIVRAIRRALEAVESERPVLLAGPDVRRFLKKLIEIDLPDVRVASYAELLPEIAIKPLGKATLTGV